MSSLKNVILDMIRRGEMRGLPGEVCVLCSVGNKCVDIGCGCITGWVIQCDQQLGAGERLDLRKEEGKVEKQEERM